MPLIGVNITLLLLLNLKLKIEMFAFKKFLVFAPLVIFLIAHPVISEKKTILISKFDEKMKDAVADMKENLGRIIFILLSLLFNYYNLYLTVLQNNRMIRWLIIKNYKKCK